MTEEITAASYVDHVYKLAEKVDGRGLTSWENDFLDDNYARSLHYDDFRLSSKQRNILEQIEEKLRGD